MGARPRKVVLVIDSKTHEDAKAAFKHIKAAAASLGAVAVALEIQAFQRMVEDAKRMAELAARIHGNAFFVVDELPWPVEFKEQQAVLATLARELRESGDSAPKLWSGACMPNAAARHRMQRAAAKPPGAVTNDISRRPTPRQRQGNRHK